MRYYTFLATRPGGYMNWPGRVIATEMRIRQAAITMFRKWFGREPDFHWHSDGFMAEASDEHRNETVQLSQINMGHWMHQMHYGGISSRRSMTPQQREFGRENALEGVLFEHTICTVCEEEPLLIEDECDICANCRAQTPSMLLEDRK